MSIFIGTVQRLNQINCQSLRGNDQLGITDVQVWPAALQKYSENGFTLI